MRKEQNTNTERDATARALMVLTHEVRRMDDAAERVRLVTEALAKRYGVPPAP